MVGRTLLSAAFDLGFDLDPETQIQNQHQQQRTRVSARYFPLVPIHKLRKKTGAIAASAAPACSASTYRVCLGARGSHLIAKNASTGICPAMSSCQIWAVAPSSVSWTSPPNIAAIPSAARAVSDIASGRKALGCLTMAPKELGRCSMLPPRVGKMCSQSADQTTFADARRPPRPA